MDKIQKFLLKLIKKERAILMKILENVRILNIVTYDIKPLKGHKGFFRLRKGDIRIIFIKQQQKGIVVNIAYRNEAYRNL